MRMADIRYRIGIRRGSRSGKCGGKESVVGGNVVVWVWVWGGGSEGGVCEGTLEGGA